MSKWIKKDDKVIVITGNDKGKVGKVVVKKNDKVIVEGINVKKKHIKKRNNKTDLANIISIERPINISNVALCDDEGKAFKVKVKISDNGDKNIVYKNKEDVVFRTIKKNVK